MVTPDDVGLAGQGDLSALRRMRDYWLPIATGQAFNAHLPKDEALPQLELLAELAASGGQAEDVVALIVAYQVRADRLERDLAASEDYARQAANALDPAALELVQGGDKAGHWNAGVLLSVAE